MSWLTELALKLYFIGFDLVQCVTFVSFSSQNRRNSLKWTIIERGKPELIISQQNKWSIIPKRAERNKSCLEDVVTIQILRMYLRFFSIFHIFISSFPKYGIINGSGIMFKLHKNRSIFWKCLVCKRTEYFFVGICALKCRQYKIESNKIKGKKLNTSNHFECVYIYSKHHFLIRKSKTKIIAKNPRKANTRTMLHTIGFQAINKA